MDQADRVGDILEAAATADTTIGEIGEVSFIFVCDDRIVSVVFVCQRILSAGTCTWYYGSSLFVTSSGWERRIGQQ